MIHFRCECGRTLSAEDGAAGERISCDGCGGEREVPRASAGASVPTPSRPDTGRHDFDAEIVVAARTAPPRPVRTPDPRPAVSDSGAAPESGAAPPPAFDLLRVRASLRRLSPLAVAALVFCLAGAVAAVRFLPGGWLVRGAIGLALLSAGVGAAAALVALREVGRTVLGLADRQRELTEIVSPAEREPKGL